MRGLLVVPLLLLAAGCWQPRYFVPRENLNGTGPDGDVSAVYAVRDRGDGTSQGEVRLWSAGAKAHYAEDDSEVVDLRIGFELENTSDAPFELDVAEVRVEDLYLDGYLQDYLAPHSITGTAKAAPGTTTRVDMVFRPATTYPSDIDSFSVRFAVRDAKGQRVGQVTPFVPGNPWRNRVTVNSGYNSFGWGGFYGGVGLWGGPFYGPFYGGRFCR